MSQMLLQTAQPSQPSPAEPAQWWLVWGDRDINSFVSPGCSQRQEGGQKGGAALDTWKLSHI